MSNTSTPFAPCVGCGGQFPAQAGPVHRYMESSPGCWAVYGKVLAREYADRAYYRVHRLSVDAYAVQHPGQPSPQSVQSVAIHLISLCLVMEHGFPLDRATAAMQRMAATKTRYQWLEPPAYRGRITVLDFAEADSAAAHEQAVWRWARELWEAWRPHHEMVRLWALRKNVACRKPG